LFDYEIAL